MEFLTEGFILREGCFILTSYFSELNANKRMLNESEKRLSTNLPEKKVWQTLN